MTKSIDGTHRFQSMDSQCNIIDLALYESLKKRFPQYRTVEIVDIKNIHVDSINFKNGQGQIINLARSVGTDKNNVRLLKESIVNQGWDVSHVPPIVEESTLNLFDGFSRHEALLQLDHKVAPYLVVRVKSGFTVDQVIDEIGLGANNHCQSVRATLPDFKTRFHSYVIREKSKGNTVTTDDGIKWFSLIPHPFGDEEVEKAVEKCFSSIRASETMESFSKKEAQAKAASLLNIPKESIYVVNKDKQKGSQYLHRVVGDLLRIFLKTGKVPDVAGFLTGISADDADEKRKEIEETTAEVNKAFNALAFKSLADPNFKIINYLGHLPQIIDEEDEMIDPS